MSKLEQAPTLAATNTTANPRANRVQPAAFFGAMKSLAPDGTVCFVIKFLNSNSSTRTCCFPESRLCKGLHSANYPRHSYPKTRIIAMRLSRHSARIKAKVKAESRGFQDT